MNVRKQVPLRIPRRLHTALEKEARSQGLTLNGYVLACVQRERAMRDTTLDSVDINELAREISATRGDMQSMRTAFQEIKGIIKERAYADVDLARAKDSLMSIILDESNKDEVKAIVSIDKLKTYVIGKNPLLERYLLAGPDQPVTIVDEILYELQMRNFVALDERGRIQWGLKVWGA